MTHMPRPGTVRARPSARMTFTARVTVPTEMPYSWDIDLAEGSGAPGGYSPDSILDRDDGGQLAVDGLAAHDWRGRHGSYGTRSCPSSAPTAPGSGTSAT
jgi:hypothetical protein